MSIGTLQQYLQHFSNFGAGYYQFILENGRPWQAQALPVDIRPGKLKHCFENAARLAMGDSSLTYVEGVAFKWVPTEHAWVVREDGLVIDPTWESPEKCEYYGMAFRTDFLEQTILQQRTWGLMGSTLTYPKMKSLLEGLHPDYLPAALWLPEQEKA